VGAEEPRDLPEGELTRRFVRFMEREIRQQPEIWLWSHRRWKWPYKEEYARLRIDGSGAAPGSVPGRGENDNI
jgi:KDO2-lipid IV(A) lauroyltransferase